MSAKIIRVILFTVLMAGAFPATLMAQQGAVDYDALLRGESLPADKGAGAEGAAGVSCPAPGAPSSGAPSNATLLGLVFLLGLGGAVAALTWQRRRQGDHVAPGALRHVHSLQLGQDHKVSLIEVDGRPMVVGLTQGEIKVLVASEGEGAPLAASAQPAARRAAAAAATTPAPAAALENPGQAFDALLQRARHAPTPQSSRAIAPEPEQDYILEEIPEPVSPPERKAERPVLERESINTQGEAANVRRGIENLRNQHRKTP